MESVPNGGWSEGGGEWGGIGVVGGCGGAFGVEDMFKNGGGEHKARRGEYGGGLGRLLAA